MCSSASSTICIPSSHSGYAPLSIASHRSRRWKSGSLPEILSASSHSTEWTPSTGFQWNFTKRDWPWALTRRKVWMPKPSIMRKLRGMARSDITHMIMCIDSGITDTKSQNVSWADAAWGISLWGSGFTAWIRSGNFTASWMKNTGMLLPTRSKLPSEV